MNDRELQDYLHDYLLDPEMLSEYLEFLVPAGLDTNPENWEEFTTCYGNFINFRHKITKQVL